MKLQQKIFSSVELEVFDKRNRKEDLIYSVRVAVDITDTLIHIGPSRLKLEKIYAKP